MKGALDLGNALALALALALASWAASRSEPRKAPRTLRPPAARALLTAERLPDGRSGVRDANGGLVPLAHYRRIASATLAADRVLADLCEPDRIVAFTRHAAEGRDAYRYAGKATISARDGLEPMLALAPDLLLVSELFDASYLARLREQGVTVFELGPMAGLDTLVPAIQAIGLLLGRPERAASYAEALTRRMRAVAAADAPRARRRALYLGLYGNRLFGGAGHTSYHDVIEHAGLRDAATEAGLSGWPELSGERLLTLDPELILTRTGMGPLLCRQPGLEQLRPCRGQGSIVELDGALLDDPGPGILDATEALHAACRPH